MVLLSVAIGDETVRGKCVIFFVVVVVTVESLGMKHVSPVVSLIITALVLLYSRFPEDAYDTQPFIHPHRCLRRRSGPQLVRLPAHCVQKTEQRVAREVLLQVCVGFSGE